MTDTQRDVASFLVRFTQDLWRNTAGEPESQWRGRIRHVQGEEELTFTDFAQALRFIQGHLAQLTLSSIPGGSKMDQEKALSGSFKLWEQFANSYSNMMFEAMERTIQQSEAIRSQMDQAVEETMKTMRLPVKSDESQVIVSINELSEKVDALAKKLDKLEKTLAKETK